MDDAALEQSNVNISTEFSNLIVAQRAFEANSKTVTTFDTISQDVIVDGPVGQFETGRGGIAGARSEFGLTGWPPCCFCSVMEALRRVAMVRRVSVLKIR